MTGAVMGLAGSAGGAGGGSGVVVSPLPSWSNITGIDNATSNDVTLAGISTPISISAALWRARW